MILSTVIIVRNAIVEMKKRIWQAIEQGFVAMPPVSLKRSHQYFGGQ
jgi:hypothetical protein